MNRMQQQLVSLLVIDVKLTRINFLEDQQYQITVFIQKVANVSGSETYNFYADSDAQNYFKSSLKVGGGTGQTDLIGVGYGNQATGVGLNLSGAIYASVDDSAANCLHT